MNRSYNKISENVPVDQVFKHYELNEAIMSIGALNNQLDYLISKITGKNNDKVCREELTRPVVDNPALVDVLNEGQFVIKSAVEAAHEQISMIETLLFFR